MQKHIVDRLNDAVSITNRHGLNEVLLDASSKIKDLLSELERFHLYEAGVVALINTTTNKLIDLSKELHDERM